MKTLHFPSLSAANYFLCGTTNTQGKKIEETVVRSDVYIDINLEKTTQISTFFFSKTER